jgi:hypothetical protein
MSLVVRSNAVHSSHSLSLAAAREQELWRFIEMEEEESTDEHSKCDCSKCKDKVPPAHVVSFGARNHPGFAGEVGDVGPRN